MRREYLEYVKEYADRLEPYMKELEDSGQWRRLERSPVSNYSFGKDGVVFVYRVIQNGSSSMASKII
ncbi:hypothetical protein LSH36_519g03074 [Paralvinella palmiformis]|uniref:Uncharacterized protein n=1 Tax=Paralvinella palmiformis TaxID=53620 RepID=A0AAD9MWH8_9ANNE|nr:hypothetical protein LSH36_519g03074 [Paralvinella palmiformis]